MAEKRVEGRGERHLDDLENRINLPQSQCSNLDIKTRFSYSDQSIKHTHKKTRQPDQRLGVGVYDMKKIMRRIITAHSDMSRMRETKIQSSQ